MNARFAGTCGSCGCDFDRGTRILFDRRASRAKRTLHVDCSHPAEGFEALTPNRARRSRRYDADPHGSRYTRFQGGGESFTNAAGRCEDAPCCGCCS